MTKLYIMLGRHGDICSILPLLYSDFQKTGEKQGLMVAAECASMLDGVGYVEPIVYQGPHYEIEKAVLKAHEICANVVCLQVNGPKEQVRDYTYKPAGTESAMSSCFQKEQWRVAGRIGEWDDCLPLVLDRRNTLREKSLLTKNGLLFRGKKKPLIVLALKSNSSPFPYADLLRELVTNRFKDTHRIIELPQAERIYDLLAIYERASLLIAVDSAPLHLAWACRKLPVFALTQDKPLLWNGSPWRPNHLWYCRYSDFPQRSVEMVECIDSLSWKYSKLDFVTVWNTPKQPFASKEYLAVTMGMTGRDSANTIQDEKRFPYLRDVVRMAMQRASSDDTQIRLTRPHVILGDIKTSEPCFSYRMTETKDGNQFAPVADLFCAPKAFWKRVLPSIPDLILGNDHYWSQCLWALFKQEGAIDATGCCVFAKAE